MSWMDDGGFEIRAFTAKDGMRMARMVFRTSTGQYDITLSKTDLQRIKRECNRTLRDFDQEGDAR